MNTDKTIECPYCGSTIRSHVEVCLYCRREVHKIITLQAELEKYKAIAEASPKPPEPVTPVVDSVIQKKKKKIPLGFFAAGFIIIFSIVLTYSLESAKGLTSFPLYEMIFFLCIPVVIYIGITFVSDFSIWVLAVLGLFLPKIIYYLALELQLQPSLRVLGSFGKAPFVFGAYVLLAGLLFTVLIDKVELKRVFGISTLTDYLNNTQTLVDKIEKLILIVTTVLASIKTIAGIL